MKRNIYLFRHGQTHFNRAKRFTGWLDSTWTKEGEKNAKTVAQKLKNARIDIAFCTRLKRSRLTLKEVLKNHPECSTVFIDDRMMERCYGTLQGQSHKEFIKKNGKELFDKYHRAYDYPPPQGESIKMVEKRVKSFIKDLLKFVKKNKANVAISAHGNSMRPFRRHFEKASINKMMQWSMPYDNYFKYSINVPPGKQAKTGKKIWKAVRLPKKVKLATDQRNTFKKYY